MSRPVKDMIVEHYRQRFDGVDNAVIVDIRGIDANTNNEFRIGLLKQDIRVTVVKNTLARKAFEQTGLAALGPALEGPAAVVYGAESVVDVARAIVDWAKKVKNLELKGACLDGRYYDGVDGVRELSKLPTRDEAIAIAVQIVLSPARNAVGTVVSPGANILGIVKEIQERLERGESITKVA